MDVILGWKAGPDQKEWAQPANELGLGPVQDDVNVPGPLQEAFDEADRRLQEHLKTDRSFLGALVVTSPGKESQAILGVELDVEALIEVTGEPVSLDGELMDRIWDVKDELREEFSVFYHAEPFLYL